MASSYTTSFGIEKIGSGEQSGAWGTTTNHNLDILDRIASYKAVAITTNADTATLTVREASPGSGTENLQDGMYRVVKFTGALDSNCTVTIAPETTSAFFIIINATTDSGSSGPYSIILTQGSGANITVGNGKSAVIYCDGAGGGAAVIDALSDLQLPADLSLASDSSVIKMGADDDITVTHVADTGLKLKQAGATGDDKPFVLTLQTGEVDIAASDVLGQIDFQAPDEATTGDSQLVAAGIAAISEGDFSSSNNATKLSFKTAASEAASEKASLSSTGVFTATSFTGSGAGLTAGTTPITTLDIDGGTDIGEAIVDADLFIVDNGAGGTNRKVAASRLKTYASGGEASGPGSSTDNAIARFDGTGGKTLQNSSVTISDANAIAGAASISFGDSTLANYETGTWTPDFYGLTTGTGAANRGYSTQTGTYTRIGRMVFIQFQITVNDWNTSAVTNTGQLACAGLPFTVTTAINVQPTAVGYSANVDIPGTAGVLWSLHPCANTTRLDTNYYDEGDSSSGGALTTLDFNASSQVRFCGSYFTDAS